LAHHAGAAFGSLSAMWKSNRPYVMRAHGFWDGEADALLLRRSPQTAPLVLPYRAPRPRGATNHRTREEEAEASARQRTRAVRLSREAIEASVAHEGLSGLLHALQLLAVAAAPDPRRKSRLLVSIHPPQQLRSRMPLRPRPFSLLPRSGPLHSRGRVHRLRTSHGPPSCAACSLLTDPLPRRR